jgi:hypothetical protein
MRSDPFAGSWQVTEATLPNGKPGYTGSIEIRRFGAAYGLEWSISDGSYVGVGCERSGNLLVACGPQRAGLGLAFFLPEGDRVRIFWTVPELQGALGQGELVSPWRGSFAGAHQLRQLLPDGSEHGRFTAEMKPLGEVFEIRWSHGGDLHFRGLGFAAAGGLAAAWYPDPGQLALLDYAASKEAPDTLEGRWALGGFPDLATEKLKRLG